jgi:aspartyl-tRNA(Asn)/glutamyl-tRNA(Gln) amidotransferase subunit A
MVYPTVAATAPSIAETNQSDDDYFRWNLRLLRNTGVANVLDGCAATVPCHSGSEAPVGFSVGGFAGEDRRILAIAMAVERELAPLTGRIPR